MSRQTVLSEAIALPADQRLDLVMEIWNSLAADPSQVGTTAEQRDELDRRRAAYEAHPENTTSADEAIDTIEREL